MTTMCLSTVHKWCSRGPVPRMRGFVPRMRDERLVPVDKYKAWRSHYHQTEKR